MERFACPTPDRQGRYRCIDDHVLCDGFIDCPSGEDEDRQSCMFYKTVTITSQLLKVYYKSLAKDVATNIHIIIFKYFTFTMAFIVAEVIKVVEN